MQASRIERPQTRKITKYNRTPHRFQPRHAINSDNKADRLPELNNRTPEDATSEMAGAYPATKEDAMVEGAGGASGPVPTCFRICQRNPKHQQIQKQRICAPTSSTAFFVQLLLMCVILLLLLLLLCSVLCIPCSVFCIVH